MKKMITLAAVVAMAASGWADWPQYLGPDRNAMSTETGLARSWPDSGPRVVWTVEAGEGFAASAIRDGELYFLDREDGERDILRCLDFETGKELWRFDYDSKGSVSHPGSRATPTVDEDRIYTVGTLGIVHCISRETHQSLWSHDLIEEFDGKLPKWGFSQSPSLYKDMVIVAAQGAEAGVVAFQRETGEVVWKSPALPGKSSYVSPRIVTIGGVDQAVMVMGANKDEGSLGTVTGIDVRDGSVLWSYGGWQCGIPIAPPTPMGDGRLFITGGYGAGSVMIKVERKGGSFQVRELFASQEMGSQIHSPLLLDNYMYLNSNGNKRRDGMMCMTLDGEVVWKTGKEENNFERGALMFADGLIFNLDGKEGELRLIEPSPEGYKELASVDLELSSKSWAPLVLLDGKLILRDQKRLICLDVRTP